jgi:hypothetical protein
MSSKTFSQVPRVLLGILFILFGLILSLNASQKDIVITEVEEYRLETRLKEEAPIVVMESYPSEDRLCDNLDEIIEILEESGIDKE